MLEAVRGLASPPRLCMAATSTARAAGGDEPIVLRMAAIAPEGTGWARELKAMARELEATTHGGVHMKWYLGGIAGDETAAIGRVRRGQLDGAAGALFCGSLSPTLAVTRIAGLVQSREEALYLVNHLKPRIDEDFKRAGFVASSSVTSATTSSSCATASTASPSSRSAPCGSGTPMTSCSRQMELMGMHMVPAGIEELTGLYDGGKIDGMFVIPTAALAFQWTTRAKYFIDLRSSMLAGCLALAQKSYDQLDLRTAAGAPGAAAKFAVRFEDLGGAKTRSCSAGCSRSRGYTSWRRPSPCAPPSSRPPRPRAGSSTTRSSRVEPASRRRSTSSGPSARPTAGVALTAPTPLIFAAFLD